MPGTDARPPWVGIARGWGIALLVPVAFYLVACVLFLRDNPASGGCGQGDATVFNAYWQWFPLGLECRDDQVGLSAGSAFPRGQWVFTGMLVTSLALLASTTWDTRRRNDSH